MSTSVRGRRGHELHGPLGCPHPRRNMALARQTGFDEKSLHRMLDRRGNPTASSLAAIVRAIRQDLGIVPRITVAAA